MRIWAFYSSVPGKFWTDSLVHDDAALELLVEVMGEARVILGTDYLLES